MITPERLAEIEAAPREASIFKAEAQELADAYREHAQWGRFDISAGSNDPAAENYYRVASVSNVNNSDQNQANAKLIGAAPDLLLALREIADDYADRFDMDSPSTNPGMKYVVKQAREAIAKATGCAA